MATPRRLSRCRGRGNRAAMSASSGGTAHLQSPGTSRTSTRPCRATLSLYSTAGTRSRRPLAAAPRSDLKHERKGHQMSVHMVQAKVKSESVTHIQAAAKNMFAAINSAQPEGIRYGVVSAPRRRDVRRAAAGRRRCGKSTSRVPRIPASSCKRRRGVAYRAGQRSTAHGRRLVPVVLRAAAEISRSRSQ